MSGKYVHYMALVLSSYNRFIISNSSHQYQVKTDSQTSFFIEILTYQIYNSTKKNSKIARITLCDPVKCIARPRRRAQFVNNHGVYGLAEFH